VSEVENVLGMISKANNLISGLGSPIKDVKHLDTKAKAA